MTIDSEILINNFATRSFRDTADGDYIAARLAYRAGLTQNFLWSSLQAIENTLNAYLFLTELKLQKVMT
jgi:hypothetical protein